MSAYFIAGIGTEVGKTFITCALIRQLRGKRIDVHAYKPVISGFGESHIESSDSALLLQAMERPVTPEQIAAISPWRYPAPLSPHLAAEKVSDKIDEQAVITWCRNKITSSDSQNILLFEGAGGLMVPVNRNTTLLDIIKALSIPVILVSSSYLGAINHTLLSYELLKAKQISLSMIVICEADAPYDVGLEDTTTSIGAFIDAKIPVLSIPRVEEGALDQLPDLTRYL